MSPRALATALALNRTAFGIRFVLQPADAGKSWIGLRSAKRAQTQVFARALGARDVALGLGALAALRGAGPARPWMLAHAVADGTDLAATLAARSDLPQGPFAFAVGMAGLSTAIGVYSSVALDS